MSAFLALAVAELVGNVTGLPASVAPATYAGPPAHPAVVVQLRGEEQHNVMDGTTRGTLLVALYGGASLDRLAFTDARGFVSQDFRETEHGTVSKVEAGQLSEMTLPSGVTVRTVVMPVTGHAAVPVLQIGETLPMEGRALIGQIAGAVSCMFVFGMTGERLGSSEVLTADAAVSTPGRVLVTGTIATTAATGQRLGDYAVGSMVEAATASLIGNPTPLGRVALARVLSTDVAHDGRTSTLVSRVEIATAYSPA